MTSRLGTGKSLTFILQCNIFLIFYGFRSLQLSLRHYSSTESKRSYIFSTQFQEVDKQYVIIRIAFSVFTSHLVLYTRKYRVKNLFDPLGVSVTQP